MAAIDQYLSYEIYLIVGNWKKRKEIISYVSYISYELNLIVRN